jgi:hypothetical protein
MSKITPVFQKWQDGTIDMVYSAAANNMKGRKTEYKAKDRKIVRAGALRAAKQIGGDLKDGLTVLGEYLLQFGQFQGKSFRWVVENALGWACAIIHSMSAQREVESAAPLSQNKFDMKRYVESFEEGRRAIEQVKKNRRPGKFIQ